MIQPPIKNPVLTGRKNGVYGRIIILGSGEVKFVPIEEGKK